MELDTDKFGGLGNDGPAEVERDKLEGFVKVERDKLEGLDPLVWDKFEVFEEV